MEGRSGQASDGAALKSTPGPQVENSEDDIPVVILKWNGEFDKVEDMNFKPVLPVVVRSNSLKKISGSFNFLFLAGLSPHLSMFPCVFDRAKSIVDVVLRSSIAS